MNRSGTLKELMDAWLVEFKKQTPEEQEETRKQVYEGTTGKKYDPAKHRLKEAGKGSGAR